MEWLDRAASEVMPFAIGWFVVFFSIRTAVILQRGYKVELGRAKGNPRRGVLYSLTFSMVPWKKDSTRRHPLTYLAGMGMHVGTFLTIAFALGRRYGVWSESWTVALAVAAGIGLLSALGLFLKRISEAHMRAISSPDDFISSLVVQTYLLGGLLTALAPGAEGLWRLGAVMLLFYIPLGKMYHMLLFFVSRTLFGLQFGRRGVLQHDLPISY